jgi:hypothetical protein
MFAGDFPVSDRTGEPCRTGTDYPGLFGSPVGLCRGTFVQGSADALEHFALL